MAFAENRSFLMILFEDALGANSELTGCDSVITTPPREENIHDGQSVRYIRNFNKIPFWFPIRATFCRAQQIYDRIRTLDFGGKVFEPYLPLLRKIVYSNDDFKNPTDVIHDEPLDMGLLFLRTAREDFREVLKMKIPGLTPYYNRQSTNGYGINDYLTVPDSQMKSFRIIVESGNENILIDQAKAPSFVQGDDVVVVGGPFAGVEGKVMRFQSQKRVFVDIPGLGCFGTAYVPAKWLRRIE